MPTRSTLRQSFTDIAAHFFYNKFMPHPRRIVLVFALAAALVSLRFAEARMWMDVSGAFRVEADMLQILSREVLLKTKDGRQVKVDIARLSAEDQKFIATSRAAARLEGNRRYMLEVKPGKVINATYAFTANVPNLKALDWSVIAARPPELPSQSKISFSMTPDAEEAQDQSPHARTIFIAQVPAHNGVHEHSLKAELKIRAQLYERALKPRTAAAKGKPPREIVLSDTERARYLAPTGMAAHESDEFKQWLDEHQLRARPDEGQVDFAQRVFLHMRGNFDYEYTDKMDRNVMAVCKAGVSDCGGLSIVMCSILRSNDIPARLLVGRWAESDMEGQKVGDTAYHQQHVKMEFFADGVGWVPLDLSSSILHDHSAEGLYCFGRDPGDFLTMHLESDLVVDSRLFKYQTVPWLQGVAFWVSGRGSMEGRSAKESWKVADAAK